jgi:predicted XRE-type DNA-binding protein
MSAAQQEPSTFNLMENAKFLHAYLECSDAIQQGVQAMLRILFDPDTTEAEKAMAKHTIADALFPNLYKGELGMDLEESEHDAACDNQELCEIVSEMNLDEQTFAENLRRIMDERGMTQAQLAEASGVGQPAISNMLNRDCRPQRRTIERFASVLGVSPDDLWKSGGASLISRVQPLE